MSSYLARAKVYMSESALELDLIEIISIPRFDAIASPTCDLRRSLSVNLGTCEARQSLTDSEPLPSNSLEASPQYQQVTQ